MSTLDPPGQGTRSLVGAFTLLEVMAHAAQPLSPAELSARSGLSASTVRKLVATLALRGYLLTEEDGSVSLGPRLIHLGATASLQLGDWARPQLDGLVAETGATASIAVLDSDEVVYLGQSRSRHSLGTFSAVGARVSPHCTAVGKVLLGQLEDNRVRETLERTGMPALTDRTITDLDEFLDQLTLVRRQGYAFDDGENDIGVRCVAIPVPASPRILAISLSAPDSRLSVADAIGFLPVLERAAVDLSDALGRDRLTLPEVSGSV